MNAAVSGRLAVDGARLHVEVYQAAGDLPVLLLIPGGSGDAGPYAPVARELADRYRVVTYDRRGYSRSRAESDPPENGWLDADVADAAALLDRFTPTAPALVFGSSSGAIVGLALLARYPERVRRLVAHEPPLLGLLPDAAEQRRFTDAVVERYEREGAESAMVHFDHHAGIPHAGPEIRTQLPAPALAMLARMDANRDQFLRSELRQYTVAVPDWAALAPLRDRIALVGGEESRATLPYQPNLVLAARLGLAVRDLPGDHLGYVTRPTEFAAALDTALTGALIG